MSPASTSLSVDVGADTRTGVNDRDYQVPFPFNGKIDKVTFNLGPMQLSEDQEKTAAKAIAICPPPHLELQQLQGRVIIPE
jgi:hypothetical protein